MKPLSDPERAELSHLLGACPLSGKMALEIGCGDGSFSRQYAHFAHSVVGIDPLASEIKVAMNKSNLRRSRNLHFLQGKAEKLPFPDQSFEVVFFASSL